jgi:chorismate synthase
MIRFLTSGESHGKKLAGILEGMPAGLDLSESYINYHLSRRQKGFGRSDRMKQPDTVEIVSGIYQEKTAGSPITCIIKNNPDNDWLYEPGQDRDVYIPRPGHADYEGLQKYRFDTIRPVIERASARETAMRVALGSITRKFLEECNIIIASHVIQIGTIRIDKKYFSSIISASEILQRTESSPLNVIDPAAEKFMTELITHVREEGDSLGGIIELIADGLPPGLGSYRHCDKRLTGMIMQAIGSIPGAKGVEIGDGFSLAGRMGSDSQDEFSVHEGKISRLTNHYGGLEGGMTTGQPLIIRAVMKPIPTIRKSLSSFDIRTKAPSDAHYERADVCAVPAFGVIAESMLALTLINPFLEKFGGDSVQEIKERYPINKD